MRPIVAVHNRLIEEESLSRSLLLVEVLEVCMIYIAPIAHNHSLVQFRVFSDS
jgi:hypothetical protein